MGVREEAHHARHCRGDEFGLSGNFDLCVFQVMIVTKLSGLHSSGVFESLDLKSGIGES